MFLKQFNYKPRSNSQSSTDSTSSAKNDLTDAHSTGAKGAASSQNAEPGAVKGGSGTAPTPAGGRRRSSVGSPFAGLTTLKRGSGDAESDARKASFMEQKPGAGGPLANMWNKFTKGPTGTG